MTTKLDTTEAVLDWVHAEATGTKPIPEDWSDPAYVAYRVTAEQLAQGQRLLAAWPSLFPAIAHGDEEHRAWLKDKLEAWLVAAVAAEDGGGV